jgi:hypothetical protein
MRRRRATKIWLLKAREKKIKLMSQAFEASVVPPVELTLSLFIKHAMPFLILLLWCYSNKNQS